MRRITVALLALSSFLCAQNQTSPVFGWKQVRDTTYELDPMQYKIIPGMARRILRIQIQVDADSGVFIASMPVAFIRAKQMKLTTDDFERANCGRTGIIKDVYQCVMRPGERLLVRDKRGLGASLGTVAGVVTHSGDLIDRTTKPNKVKLVISVWSCIDNCNANRVSH
jgi:hypothetical protein